MNELCKKERELVEKLTAVAGQGNQSPPVAGEKASQGNAAAAAKREKTDLLNSELRAVQGDNPLVYPRVDKHVIAEVISNWTGIPLGKMVKDELKVVLDLEAALGKRVLGQQHVLKAVAERIRISRANLNDPNKPKGVFIFVGPSGVGKTETALALADILYGGERRLVTINMSEY